MEAQVSLTVAFSSSAFVGLLTILHRFSMFRSGVSHLDSLWGSGLVSLLASQAHQHRGHLTNFLVLLAVWAGAKSCWKSKSASLKAGQQKEA